MKQRWQALVSLVLGWASHPSSTTRQHRDAPLWMRNGRLALLVGIAWLGATGHLQAADSPYKGQTLRFLTSANVHQKAMGKQLERIAKEWGIQLDVRYVTTDELAKKLDITSKGVEWNLKLLRDSGLIRRVGPDKGGCWEVLK